MEIRIACLTTLLCGVCLLPILRAEDPEDNHVKHHKLWELLNTLSGDERATLHDARKQALQNPEVAAAEERRKKADAEYRELLEREMLRVDPALKPLLEKESELRHRAGL